MLIYLYRKILVSLLRSFSNLFGENETKYPNIVPDFVSDPAAHLPPPPPNNATMYNPPTTPTDTPSSSFPDRTSGNV